MRFVSVDDLEFTVLWDKLFQVDDCQYPLYQSHNLRYYKHYQDKSKFKDVSFIIENNNQPVLGIRSTLEKDPDGLHYISCYGLPLFFIENRLIDHSTRRSAYKILKYNLDQLHNNSSGETIFQECLIPNNLSVVGKYLMEKGAKAFPFFSQIIDLCPTEKELHSKIRKSYKSLINWGEKNLNIRILDWETVKKEDIELFRELHFNAAGKETRPRKSWDIQYEMICHKEAFAVTGELDGDLVTAALFPYSSKYCYYGVSASKRELIEKPLSHALIWKAMKYAKEKGCLLFEMGTQEYPNQGEKIPTKKELNISSFKRGFGGQTKVRININLYVNNLKN